MIHEPLALIELIQRSLDWKLLSFLFSTLSDLMSGLLVLQALGAGTGVPCLAAYA